MICIPSRSLAKPLNKGDEVQTVAVSSAIHEKDQLLEGLKVLEEWGLTCREEQVFKRQWGYLAGKDAIRQSNLHPKNPAALTVFARGGWGAARLLEHHQPWQKGWLIGYSDVSALLLARLAAGFDGCIHGPLLTSLAKEPPWSKERLHSLLFGESIPDLFGQAWQEGIAQGPLVACNLTVASHLIGSRHIPDLNGAILVLEDIGEEPYRIDRMLTQWRLAGLLQGLAGLAFGQFIGCEPPIEVPINKTFQLNEVLLERSRDLQIPIVGELPIGHICGNAALPLGRQATLDGNTGTLSFNA